MLLIYNPYLTGLSADMIKKCNKRKLIKKGTTLLTKIKTSKSNTKDAIFGRHVVLHAPLTENKGHRKTGRACASERKAQHALEKKRGG